MCRNPQISLFQRTRVPSCPGCVLLSQCAAASTVPSLGSSQPSSVYLHPCYCGVSLLVHLEWDGHPGGLPEDWRVEVGQGQLISKSMKSYYFVGQPLPASYGHVQQSSLHTQILQVWRCYTPIKPRLKTGVTSPVQVSIIDQTCYLSLTNQPETFQKWLHSFVSSIFVGAFDPLNILRSYSF